MKLSARPACLVLVLGLLACSSARKTSLSGPGPAGGQEEPSLRGPEFSAAEGLAAVPFEFDDARLGDAARQTLRKNAAAIKAAPRWEVLVEGHCDERGTIEYNLALGQKRAKAVRDYYIMLGVPGGRVATRSYGKEAPSCAEPVEACWSRNRRADTKVREVPAQAAAGRK